MDEMHKHIIVKSKSTEIRAAEGKLKKILGSIDLTESEQHNLLVAASEAVNNAISHGNKGDPSKKVNVDVDYRDHEVVISVEDEGGGFNPDELPDPLLPENLLKTSGRGIHIMRSLMDAVEFEFTSRGTRTRLKLKLGKPENLA